MGLTLNAKTWAGEVEVAQKHLDAVRSARDNEIRDAHKGGATIADLARATKLTRTMLYKIINKEEA